MCLEILLHDALVDVRVVQEPVVERDEEEGDVSRAAG